MKTSEFKRIIKNCELYTGDLDAASRISLGDSDFGNYDVAYISPNDQWIFSIQPCFCHIKPKYIHTVWQAIFDYAATPIAEREDKPKFFVHLIDYKFGYLAMTTGQWGIKPSLVLDTKDSVDDDGYNLNDNQAVFTELEYNKIRKYEFNKGYVLPEYDRQNTAMFEPVEEKQ